MILFWFFVSCLLLEQPQEFDESEDEQSDSSSEIITINVNDLRYQPYVKITRLRESQMENANANDPVSSKTPETNEINTSLKRSTMLRYDYIKKIGNENKRKVEYSLLSSKRAKRSTESNQSNNGDGEKSQIWSISSILGLNDKFNLNQLKNDTNGKFLISF